MELISPSFRLEFREFCVGLVLRQIDDIFRMAGIPLSDIPLDRHINGDRRKLVEQYYASIDWTNEQDCKRFLTVVSLVLSQSYISQDDKNFILSLCQQQGWAIDGHSIQFPDVKISGDLFKMQFPAGLPFGTRKPNFSVTSHMTGQSLRFDMESGIGIIWGGVYPSYDFQSFQSANDISSETNSALKRALFSMNQTESEKVFFQTYAKHFRMADEKIPLLIPQAWTQWHSLTKQKLLAKGSHLANEPFRLDFVAFWENKRFAILIDDISHYAVKRGNQWIADEASYSKRLDEDRKLQMEGWHVCRVSNWEIRNQEKVMGIVANLQRVFGF